MDQAIHVLAQPKPGEKPFGLQGYFFEDLNSACVRSGIRIYFHEFSFREEATIRTWSIDGQNWRIQSQVEANGLIFDRVIAGKKENQDIAFNYFKKIEDSNTSIVNSIKISELCQDKISFYNFCKLQGKPCVPHMSAKEAKIDDQNKHRQFIFKPRYGFGGAGFFIQSEKGRLESIKDGSILDSDRTALLNDEHIVASPLIDCLKIDNRPFDLRVFVQRKNDVDPPTVVATVLRLGKHGSIVSNLSSAGEALPHEVVCNEFSNFDTRRFFEAYDEAVYLCEFLSTKLLQLGEYAELGFDVLFTKRFEPLVLEANSKPARWAFEQIARDVRYCDEVRSKYANHRLELMNNLSKFFKSKILHDVK